MKRRGGPRAPRTLSALLWVPLALAVAPGGVWAQGSPQDTIPVDSTRLRIMDRLRRLDRGPLDAATVARTDSLLAAGDTTDIPEELRPSDLDQGRRTGRAGPTDPTGAQMEEYLRGLIGYTLTEYDAERAEFSTVDRKLNLTAGEGGSAEIRREGMILTADSSIVYDERAGRLRAQGDSVVLVPPTGGDPVTSKLLIYDMNEGRGSAIGAQTQYRESGNWKIYGDLPYLSDNLAYGDHARFTSCEELEPHYHFETDELKIVGGGGVLVARPVKLYFSDVPVAWLPFVAQSTSSGRASGILTPTFSVNDIARTSSGYNRRISNVGFYWAINDFMDTSVAMDWFSNNYTSMTGTYRYRWLDKFMDGNLNLRQFWREGGGQEMALDTRHQWAPDERTDLRISARYASSSSFVRENTFDPREVTQSIDSEAGLNRRFSWGSMALSANRRQYLSDDRVESTMPQVTLSLQPLTIFENLGTQAKWYNNWTWLGSTNFSRRTVDRPIIPDSVDISKNLLDEATNQAGINSSFNFGAVSWSQSFSFREQTYKDFLVPADSALMGVDLGGFLPFGHGSGLPGDLNELGPGRILIPGQVQDVATAAVDWNTSVGYQQRLVGTTTLTPRLSLSGNLVRDDNIEEASETFVSAPTRMTVGAQLKSDLYGFWPGFGRYEAVRHKFTPTFDYAYSPAVSPTELQQAVFNSRELDATNTLQFGFNQTFEAKIRPEEGAEAATEEQAPADGSPRRLARAQTVSLLALRTTAITYDFTNASEEGHWSRGFAETLSINNQVSSDFLRGLNFSLEHDVFKPAVEGQPLDFAPHLSRANVSFSLGSQSGIFQWISRVTGGSPDPAGLIRPEDQDSVRAAEDLELLDPTQSPGTAGMLPGTGNSSFAGSSTANRRDSRGSDVGSWSANLSYSLVRPRASAVESQQMIQANVRFKPTEKWDVAWQTSYDVTAGGFNDHILRLSRDLHRWEAAFDFRQTATGNWTFRFEVSLLDNRDLKFDYKQQDMVDGLTR